MPRAETVGSSDNYHPLQCVCCIRSPRIHFAIKYVPAENLVGGADTSSKILFTVIFAYCAPLILLAFVRGVDILHQAIL